MIGAHLNKIVPKKRVILRTNVQINKEPVIPKIMLEVDTKAGPITNQIPQGFFLIGSLGFLTSWLPFRHFFLTALP